MKKSEKKAVHKHIQYKICPGCGEETPVKEKYLEKLDIVNKRNFELLMCQNCGGKILVEVIRELT